LPSYRLATAIVILYPVISDRLLRTIDNECVLLPDQNPVFVVAMAFVGHHVPCAIIVVCYAVVYYEIHLLIKTRPQKNLVISLSMPSLRRVSRFHCLQSFLDLELLSAIGG